jgi:hypothetical protein
MEAAVAIPAWRANLATIGALMARAKNELIRVPGAAIPGVLAPTIFFLGLNGVFGALTQLKGWAPAPPAPPPGSTSPATSSRAGSTGCWSPPPRAGYCSPAPCWRPAPAR